MSRVCRESSHVVPFVTLPVTHDAEFAGFPTVHANSGQISTRRDGRVVDGGGLENRNALSSIFALLRLNSARHAR